MSSVWDRKNQKIKGTYMGAAYVGVVGYSRVKAGGRVGHSVDLIDPIMIHGNLRYSILIEETDNFVVDSEDVMQYD